MRKIMNFLLMAATVCGISLAAASCSSSDDENKEPETLTAQTLAGLWVTEYAESGTDGERTWTRALDAYRFEADGTGYYESYLLDAGKFVKATSVRDYGTLHFTISGNTVTVKGDRSNKTQTLTYADGKLTAQGKNLLKATAEQQALVDQLYADWQGANSGDDDDNNNGLNDVNGNADVNNGGGGVNEVR